MAFFFFQPGCRQSLTESDQSFPGASPHSRANIDPHAACSRLTLCAEISRLATHSVAPRTLQLYQQAASSFNLFRAALGYSDAAGIDTAQVAEYIAWLSLQSKSHSTVCAYVSGISFWFKLNSLPDPTNSFLVTKLIGSLRRHRPRSDTRQPISGNTLLKLTNILPTVTKSDFETTLYRTAFILAFFGFLRLNEFTCVNKGGGARHGLRTTDVVVQRTGGQQPAVVAITLQHSKTNQFGREQTIRVGEIPGNPLCPVRAVQLYTAIRPKSAIAFFAHFDASPVTRYQFQAMLKKATSAAGLDTQHFRSHSFRIGATTAAALAGCQPELIKSCGRWRSDAYKTYIRQPTTIPAKLLI